ncbi:hypothetical protein SNOG_16350 [Parastagonospora nodorum SN15]|uniref:Uncharacterized protein n=1 Tax=Phaeosphaeria nodorum (strain SN15 / ATCC MYA-4574 / FGSC 10173) TaxID=321614 RepID=Q0TW39_PHANO|nr:hypothetical protein SNOG_16350 [Parastagonospora nodorum SN15]EAT76336.1 hypothetical protein SNOG_16350 [Parastagonospora nodorum SN15]
MAALIPAIASLPRAQVEKPHPMPVSTRPGLVSSNRPWVRWGRSRVDFGCPLDVGLPSPPITTTRHVRAARARASADAVIVEDKVGETKPNNEDYGTLFPDAAFPRPAASALSVPEQLAPSLM